MQQQSYTTANADQYISHYLIKLVIGLFVRSTKSLYWTYQNDVILKMDK